VHPTRVRLASSPRFAVLLCVLISAGCSSDHNASLFVPLGPTYDVVGAVQLEGTAMDSAGVNLGPLIADAESGIPVKLTHGAIVESTTTVQGHYTFSHVPSGPAVVSVHLATNIEASASLNVSAVAAVAPTLRILSSGLEAHPNPFAVRTFFSKNLTGSVLVGAEVVALNGELVKVTRTGGFYGPGLFQSSWDGTDSSGNPMPAGYYWAEITVLLSPTNGTRALVQLQRP
jgi:hypothetical protein